MRSRIVCANMFGMSELRDRLLRAVATEAAALIEAEIEVEATRARLHAAIQAAGDQALDKEDQSGPSAIARAGHHRYTREYIGELLKRARA